MATRKKPARVEVPSRFRGEVTDADCDAATRILSLDYDQDVLGVAADLARQMKEGEVDDFHDALHQAVDGSARVVYTWQAKLAVILSENGDAYFEELGEEGACSKDGINWERIAFAAMERDVVQALEARSADPNDPRSWPDIDLSEFKD